jgi:hypothetical protein
MFLETPGFSGGPTFGHSGPSVKSVEICEPESAGGLQNLLLPNGRQSSLMRYWTERPARSAANYLTDEDERTKSTANVYVCRNLAGWINLPYFLLVISSRRRAAPSNASKYSPVSNTGSRQSRSASTSLLRTRANI